MSNDRWKVVITDLIVEPLDFERDVLQDVADVVALDAMQESELVGQIEDADAIMVYHEIEHRAARAMQDHCQTRSWVRRDRYRSGTRARNPRMQCTRLWY
jgi:hypothetical protein